MRALTPLEVEWLEDACIVLTQEELETDVDSVGPESQAVADNLVARGLAIEDPVLRGTVDHAPGADGLARVLRVQDGGSHVKRALIPPRSGRTELAAWLAMTEKGGAMAEKDQLRKQRTQLRAELEAAEAKHREIKLAVGVMWKTYLDPSAPIGSLGPAVERVAKLLGFEGFKERYK